MHYYLIEYVSGCSRIAREDELEKLAGQAFKIHELARTSRELADSVPEPPPNPKAHHRVGGRQWRGPQKPASSNGGDR